MSRFLCVECWRIIAFHERVVSTSCAPSSLPCTHPAITQVRSAIGGENRRTVARPQGSKRNCEAISDALVGGNPNAAVKELLGCGQHATCC